MAIYALEPRSILQFCAQPSWAVSTALSRGVATQDDAHVLQAALLHSLLSICTVSILYRCSETVAPPPVP
ncbi:hypothetical protein OH76DRAFT_1401812 [Lentinus brumalis]|uniref:Uncharacterized protein n=1 Tax=Lentinus brumalis TaxID=2498619 RepID=A0A371DES0_9APHY|nr:hypothetical protein OH76DRAFT_1401812 [Polyporus brumalis]